VCYNGEHVYFSVDADTEWIARDASGGSGGLGTDFISQSRVYLEELPPQAGPEAKRDWGDNDKKIHVSFRLWHAKEVWDDEEVRLGELCQIGDNTGASSGDHIHFMMKLVDSGSEFARTFDRDNGYKGAVDFSQWWDERFVLDVIGKKPTKPIKVLAVEVIRESAKSFFNGTIKAAQLRLLLDLALRLFRRY